MADRTRVLTNEMKRAWNRSLAESKQAVAERHQEHARSCDCLAHKATCCDEDCLCWQGLLSQEPFNV